MGKLADFIAMKRELAFDFERELRAVRNVVLGVTRLSGSEYTIDLAATDGYVTGSRARAAFVEALRVAIHEALVTYAHDLAREGLEHGMDQDIVGGALSAAAAPAARREKEQQPAVAAEASGTIRLAVCA